MKSPDKYLHLCRAQRLSLRKGPKADHVAARPFIPHTSVGGARASHDSQLVHGAQPVDESHSNSQADTVQGRTAHDPTGLLNWPNASSTAQQAQRSTGTCPGISETSGRPAFAPAARKGSALQAWVPRARNWASFDALDDLPDLSGYQQAEARKLRRDPPAPRQPELADCQPSEQCSEALRPLTSSLSNVAPSSRGDRPALGTAKDGAGSAHTATFAAHGRLQCDVSHSSALQCSSRESQPDVPISAKPVPPLGALIGSELPQCTRQASDRATCNAHAVPCASTKWWAAKGQEHQQQPSAAAAATVGTCRKPFAVPRPIGKAREGDASKAGEEPAQAAQGLGSQGRPSGLQPAAEDDMRPPELARTACRGRDGAQHLGSSSIREEQALDAEVTKNTTQRDASCAGNRSTDQEPVISDSWEDSSSSEHNDAGHLQDTSSEQRVNRAASQHTLLSQRTGEHSSDAEPHRQQSASQGHTAKESAKAGASGMGLAAQEGGSGQLTGRKRLKRLYNAPVSLNADADTGSGNSTEVRRIWHALHCRRRSACLSLCQT